MGFDNWIFYAAALFVAGGTCFFTAIPALVKPGLRRNDPPSSFPSKLPPPLAQPVQIP